MNGPLAVTAATAALIVLSAFFVVIEFALLGARRHRLEADAATSRSARAALRGINELTLMLACAQLGITACTFALGAVTKPAVDAALSPLISALGAPEQLAGGVAFGLSLFFVTFLHLVVGEMAPKSWAIAHPEVAAKLIAIPSRGFVWLVRPVISWVNQIANRLVAASGVTPVDRAVVGGYDVDTIRHLVDHSASVGALDASFRTQLAGVLDLQTLTVDALIGSGARPTSVAGTATVADLQQAARDSGHLRILVEPEGEAPVGVVHVRDTLLEPPGRTAGDLARPVFELDAATPVYEALARMRDANEQLAVVRDGGGLAGVVTLADVLARLQPQGLGTLRRAAPRAT